MRGTSATQTSQSNFPGGKEAVSITPERIAYRTFFLGELARIFPDRYGVRIDDLPGWGLLRWSFG